ncbi:MAG: type VI secretion system ATPase TssH, partial [Polyangiales bacterium]
PPLEDLVSLVKPVLSSHFKSALLARMTVVPYIPIGTEALGQIARMKLSAVGARAKESHGIDLVFADDVVEAIAARCREVESGARNVDHILRGTILPLVSQEILQGLAAGQPRKRIELKVVGGDIVCSPGATS